PSHPGPGGNGNAERWVSKDALRNHFPFRQETTGADKLERTYVNGLLYIQSYITLIDSILQLQTPSLSRTPDVETATITVPIRISLSTANIKLFDALRTTAQNVIQEKVLTFFDRDREFKTILNFGEDRQYLAQSWRLSPSVPENNRIQLKLLRPLQSSVQIDDFAFINRELAKSIEEHKALAGSAVVIDAKTGEILALANLPTYNPNNLNAGNGPTRNRAVTDVFEPGSTMKPFVVSAALDSGLVRSTQNIDTSAGFMKIGSFTIHDAHAEPGRLSMTVSEVIAKSSNVGAARIGLMQDPKNLWGTLNKVGFGMRTNVGFPGEVGGVLRNYKNWGLVGQATVSYGYGGINLTLLQLAQSYTVFANDGELKPITLYKRNEPVMGTKVFKKETVKTMVEMMEGVIEDGTGGNAKVKGYRVAGKTGTAEKLMNGKYEKNKNIGSFVGLIPATNPRIIMAIMIDEPTVGSHFGGAVAAPVFSNVMTGVMKILNIPRDDKLPNAVPQLEKVEPKETI
ncbi:MAG: peptidoglycan D,D-transpeptidase FtsI family protein, partial [Candidatus Methylopumilus sp.]